MKLYISIPIIGRALHEAKAHAEAIKAKLAPHGHECITPFDICPEPDRSYAHYMGRDIETLLADDIDGVVFGAGFHDSKGCRLEHATRNHRLRYSLKADGDEDDNKRNPSTHNGASFFFQRLKRRFARRFSSFRANPADGFPIIFVISLLEFINSVAANFRI